MVHGLKYFSDAHAIWSDDTSRGGQNQWLLENTKNRCYFVSGTKHKSFIQYILSSP